jgi:hypothetical protein
MNKKIISNSELNLTTAHQLGIPSFNHQFKKAFINIPPLTSLKNLKYSITQRDSIIIFVKFLEEHSNQLQNSHDSQRRLIMMKVIKQTSKIYENFTPETVPSDIIQVINLLIEYFLNDDTNTFNGLKIIETYEAWNDNFEKKLSNIQLQKHKNKMKANRENIIKKWEKEVERRQKTNQNIKLYTSPFGSTTFSLNIPKQGMTNQQSKAVKNLLDEVKKQSHNLFDSVHSKKMNGFKAIENNLQTVFELFTPSNILTDLMHLVDTLINMSSNDKTLPNSQHLYNLKNNWTESNTDIGTQNVQYFEEIFNTYRPTNLPKEKQIFLDEKLQIISKKVSTSEKETYVLTLYLEWLTKHKQKFQ